MKLKRDKEDTVLDLRDMHEGTLDGHTEEVGENRNKSNLSEYRKVWVVLGWYGHIHKPSINSI